MKRKVWTTPFFDEYEVLRGHRCDQPVFESTEFFEPEYDTTLQKNRQRPTDIMGGDRALFDDGGGIC